MAITYVGSASDAQGANTNNNTPTLPTHAADDFMLAFMWCDATPTAPTTALITATGWTNLYQDELNTDGRDTSFSLWYKKATSSSETDPVFTVDVSAVHTVQIAVFRGVDTTTPFDVTTTSNGGMNDETPPLPTITPVNDNCAIVVFGGQSHDDLSAFGAPSGYTLNVGIDRGSGAQRGYNYGAYLLDAGTAALEDPGSWTHTGNGSGLADWQNVTIALRAAGGGGGTTHTGAASLSGAATLAATGRKVARGAASITGTATIVAVGTRIGTKTGSAALSASAALTATGRKVARGAASLTATAALSVSGSASVTQTGSASLSGLATLTASGRKVARGAASLTGTASLIVSGTKSGPEFTTPVVRTVPMTDAHRRSRQNDPAYRLMRHYQPMWRGVNVWVLNDGTCTEVQPQDETTINRLFAGGHVSPHDLTSFQVTALTNAGYVVNGV